MHQTSALILLACASNTISSVSALALDKRVNTAPFKPTHCSKNVNPTDTVKCNIPGLPKTTGQISLTTATVTTTWAKPAATAAFQVVLKNTTEVRPEAGIDVYDIDLDSSETTFMSLRDAKKYIVCYFSAGTSESYRNDVGCFNHKLGAQDYGCNFGGEFPDEFWLNTTSLEVRRIMQTRIQYAKERGCSAIDPDNIDGYNNTNGIGLNPEDSVSFFKFLSTEAHSRGMGIGLKNSLDLIPHVLDDLDFAVNEQCLVFNTTSGISECTKYAPLFKLSTPVPVFNIEYPPEGKNWTKAEAEERCKETKALNLPYLHTNLKNYPTVDCGVSRCGGSGPAPGLDSKGKLPIPAGCVNSIATDDESEIAA